MSIYYNSEVEKLKETIHKEVCLNTVKKLIRKGYMKLIRNES